MYVTKYAFRALTRLAAAAALALVVGAGTVPPLTSDEPAARSRGSVASTEGRDYNRPLAYNERGAYNRSLASNEGRAYNGGHLYNAVARKGLGTYNCA
ncbi:MAG: hypothetical protein L0Z62_15120 [Gemmataceae bacterium]|nr:hypothetical protein [Gemmataceae bacterium]